MTTSRLIEELRDLIEDYTYIPSYKVEKLLACYEGEE